MTVLINSRIVTERISDPAQGPDMPCKLGLGDLLLTKPRLVDPRVSRVLFLGRQRLIEDHERIRSARRSHQCQYRQKSLSSSSLAHSNGSMSCHGNACRRSISSTSAGRCRYSSPSSSPCWMNSTSLQMQSILATASTST